MLLFICKKNKVQTMTKKYEFTGEVEKLSNGAVVRRIRALHKFNDIEKHQLGGRIESEWNLSQDITDTSWVYADAIVYGKVRICDDDAVYQVTACNELLYNINVK